MELLKLLLGISQLIFIATEVVIGNNNKNDSLKFFNDEFKSIKPIHYDINLIPFVNDDVYKNTDIYKTFKSYIDKQRAKDNFIFYGESTIYFEDIGRTHIIRLHVLNLKIDDEATEIIYTINDIDNWIVPKKHIYHNKAQTIDIHFDYPFLPEFNTYRLIMKFVGSITNTTGGFVKTSYVNDKGEKMWLLAAADFRGAGARQIFPCWDEPYSRSTFTISVKHHQNYTALSNTPVFYKSTNDNGIARSRFEATDKISPYHVATVLAEDFQPLGYYSEANWWGRQLVKEKIKFAQKVADHAVLYLTFIFGNTKFPANVNHVVIPGFRDEGVESWGLALYRETAVIYDENLDFIGWKCEVARMVARKIVYQYFGNLIGQSSWSYMWLNEGIATVLAMNIVNKYVHSQLMDLLTVQYRQESLRVNRYYDMPLISKANNKFSDINSLFAFTHYVKAPVVVQTLLHAVSKDVFEKGLNKYLTTYQFRSIDTSNNTTSINDFVYVLQETLRTAAPKSNMNLTRRLLLWTKQERYPLLQVKRTYPRNVVKIYLSRSYETRLWTFVTYTTQTNPKITREIWLSPSKPILNLTDIKRNEWIIVNAQQTGYYRVKYEIDNWRKLIKYLNSKDYLNIHVLNRAQILDDAYYFLSINKFDFRLFKNLTGYLSKEFDYVAWYTAFKILEQISGFFPFSQSTEVKEHFRKIFDAVLGSIGFTFIEEKLEEDVLRKCLRHEAAKWACVLNSWGCINSAHFKLKNIRSMRIYPGWKAWTYCNGLMTNDDLLWHRLLYTQNLDNKHLEYLACSRNNVIIIDYINKLKSGFFSKAEQRISVFHSIIVRHAKNDTVLKHVFQNFAATVPREINKIVAFVDIINHLYSEEQLNEVNNFAEKYLTFKEYPYVQKKIVIRMLQIRKHIGYFERFLTTY